MTHARIAIVLGHPDPASFNAALADAYAEGASTHAAVDRITLAQLAFDPILRAGYGGEQPLEPDLLAARATLEAAAHVAWVFPTWWAGPPALVKGFVDRCFLPGWAFRYREGSSLVEPLLGPRSARLITTMDSPAWWYWLWHRGAVHASTVNATLRFSGFGPVRRSVAYSVRSMSPADRARMLAKVRRAGAEDARRLPRRALSLSTT